jgi:hypothetical protein
MEDHQHSLVEQTRIAWHTHQFEHDCYGLDCTEDRTLYLAYQRAITGDPARPDQQTGHQERPSPDT